MMDLMLYQMREENKQREFERSEAAKDRQAAITMVVQITGVYFKMVGEERKQKRKEEKHGRMKERKKQRRRRSQGDGAKVVVVVIP